MRQIYGTTEGRLQEIDAADAAIESALGKYGATLWTDTRDISQVRGTPVSTWQSRVGADCVQPTGGKQPLFYPGGFPDGGPCLDFNGVSDYLTCAEDMSGTSKATVFITTHLDATVNLFEAMIEYGTYYAGVANGWTLMASTTSDRIYIGIGVNPGYKDGYVNNKALGTRVACGVYSTAASPELFYKPDGVNEPLTTSGPGAVGNFSASALSIGARLNGGAPERYADFLLREILVIPEVVDDNDIFTITQHMRVKAGLK